MVFLNMIFANSIKWENTTKRMGIQYSREKRDQLDREKRKLGKDQTIIIFSAPNIIDQNFIYYLSLCAIKYRYMN